MRELERDDLPSPLSATSPVVVGRGRVGRSLARPAELAGIDVRLVGSDQAGMRTGEAEEPPVMRSVSA